RRTGVTVQVPRGIDPGFAHNAGTADPVDGARALLRQRLDAAPPAIVKAAEDHLDAHIARGDESFKRLVGAAGDPDDPDFPDRLRALVAQALTTARGAGSEEAGALPALDTPVHRAAAEAVNAASLRFPASWVVRGRSVPLKAAGNGQETGGEYRPPALSGGVEIGKDVADKPEGEGWTLVSRDPGNALHEYVHHLQYVMPDIDRLFQQLHRRRTTRPDGTRDPIAGLAPYPSTGREDQYADEYFGKEYGSAILERLGYDPDWPAVEVMTRAFQLLFHKLPDYEGTDLDDLVRDDPEMLRLLLGLL
ncbi:MAG: hypothetical protein GDA41_06465, partial [Rhodospirillales bacterium]|nr:hypothetical protein [Rhodospirillales bacterium]